MLKVITSAAKDQWPMAELASLLDIGVFTCTNISTKVFQKENSFS